MAVKRIVANVACADAAALRDFYAEVFELDVVMDMGWIATLASPVEASPQISVAETGGSGAPTPSISITVDDVDAVFERAKASGAPIEYPMTDEPWGVRRFFLRDPAGALVNVLAHR
ncbi:MAG: VOC family protein [Pseudomonadota bacterium]